MARSFRACTHVESLPVDLLCTVCRALRYLAALRAAKQQAPMADEKEAVEHKTSLAVWDQDSPVVIGRTVRMKVGAKCSAGCVLKDQAIEIRNHTGASIARAALGSEPWPGTTGL